METVKRAEHSTYRLPFGEVFVNKHSGERNWRTANENLVLLTEVGSLVHGINVGGDDQDLQGICVEPPEVMLGTRPFDQYDYRSKPVNVRSDAGDLDLQVFGLSKWVRLATAGNPTVLLPLFAPPTKVLATTWVGDKLRADKHLFLAKAHAQRFLGYLNQQRRHLVGELSPRVNRPELVEKYGYDTKYASHALRIAMQGIQLMRIGDLILPMESHQRRYLIKVRKGEFTLGECLAKLGRLEEELLTAAQYSTCLPDRVDDDYINDWLVETYQAWWDQKRDTV